MNEDTPLLSPSTSTQENDKINKIYISSDNEDESVNQLPRLPWKFKLIALFCAMFLAMGSHFAAHTLGAMKSIIKKEFDISNSQYGAIQSSVSIVNTVLPLIGGIFIDAFGTIPGSILTTTLITFGNILVALSTSSKNLQMMITGRVLYGIGSGTVVIVQETILSQWFQGKSLAAVIALMLTVSRLSSFLAQATVVPIANWSGWYGYGFWFSAMLCVFSFIINLVYIGLLKKIHVAGSNSKVQRRIQKKRSFSWSKLMYLPHSYWLIASIEFLLGGGWGCFLHIDSEYVKVRFGYDDTKAAAVASVAQVLPIFLMPILGILVDKYGKRTWMMITSGLTFLLSLSLLQYTDLNPLVGMISFSASLALGPVSLVSSVPVILPLSLVGTGMGLIKSGTNIGASLFDIFTGVIQDGDAHKGYDGVMNFFIVIGLLSVLSGVTLMMFDKFMYNSVLDAEKMSNDAPYKPLTLDQKSTVNYLYAGIYITLAITSWILFVRFVLI